MEIIKRELIYGPNKLSIIRDENNCVWFKGCDVGKCLGYTKPRNAILSHVDEEDKQQLQNLTRPELGRVEQGLLNTIYINESGLYSLILSSNLPTAKGFKRWVTSEVLPSIRKHGVYKKEYTRQMLIFECKTESDLHQKVIDYLRKKGDILFNSSLGELQDTQTKRLDCWKMGYTAGICDLFIYENHQKYNGMAIEFKSPTGRGYTSDKQKAVIKKLRNNNWKVIVSNDYDLITDEIYRYILECTNIIRPLCRSCGRSYKNIKNLERHNCH